MKIKAFFLGLLAFILMSFNSTLSAQPANASGTWKTTIETPVGTFKYTFLIQQEGEKLSGKIINESDNGKKEVDLKEGKINGDAVSFVELFSMQDNEIKITYSGKISGNEMNLTREVGEFATEQITIKREVAEVVK
jgi:uncharacterized protein